MHKIKKTTNSHCIRWRSKDSQYLHRIDGPAVQFFNGATEWWVNGRFISAGTALKYQAKQLCMFKQAVAKWICHEQN